MKKKLALFSLLFASVNLPAQTAALSLPSNVESAGSWTLTSSVVSQYMFRGVLLGGAAFQPMIEYDRGALGLGFWTNFPLKDKVPGQSDPELDLYGFYAIDVTTDLTIVPGFTLYTCPKAKPSDGFYKVTFEPNIALNYSLHGVKFTPKFYYDFVTKGPAAELTASFAIPLTALGSELDFSGSIGTFMVKDYLPESDPTVKNWGDYYLVGVSAPFKIGKDSALTIGWAYTAGYNNYVKQGTDGKTANTAAVGRGVVTINYIVSF